MKLIKKLVGFYILGMVVSLVFIGLIHIYSLMFETYFCYAKWNNILVTALISGIPFGLAIWAFTILKKMYQIVC